MNLPEFQGWTNEPTWAVFQRLIEDQATMSTVHAAIEDPTISSAELSIEALVEDMIWDSIPPSHIATDLAGIALEYVNWHEIATAFLKK